MSNDLTYGDEILLADFAKRRKLDVHLTQTCQGFSSGWVKYQKSAFQAYH
jgi:hypothetical protein